MWFTRSCLEACPSSSMILWTWSLAQVKRDQCHRETEGAEPLRQSPAACVFSQRKSTLPRTNPVDSKEGETGGGGRLGEITKQILEHMK